MDPGSEVPGHDPLPGAPLALRPSPELGTVPRLRPPAAPPGAPSVLGPPIGADRLPGFVRETPRSTWAVSSLALLAGVGWLLERRRRVAIQEEQDSVMWARAHVPPGGGARKAPAGLDSILPDGPDPAEAARAIYAGAIAQTTSRREATLIDLHELERQLRRRTGQGDTAAAVQLLQRHLVDFRYSSPWVFLELRELYRATDRLREWEAAREAFRARFGQNAPQWAAPSTANQGLDADPQLAAEIARKWPQRETRLGILRWMLGDDDSRRRNAGPPLLPLGVYRDMLALDSLLDELAPARGTA